MAFADIPLWPFAPNWSTPVQEKLEWLTEVLTSPVGAEQRRSMRVMPRRTFEYTLRVEENDRSHFEYLVSQFGGGVWHLPHWHDARTLESIAPQGTSSLAINGASESGFTAGSGVMLVGPKALDCEVVPIETVGPNFLSLGAPLSRAWDIGTVVHPTRQARFFEQPNVTSPTDTGSSAAVGFRIVDVTARLDDDLNRIIGSADLYKTFSVFNYEPNFKTAPTTDYARLEDMLDNGTSRPLFVDRALRAFATTRHIFTFQGRAANNDFVRTLMSLRGRAKPFWYPSFKSDFRITANISANATFIRTEKTVKADTSPPKNMSHIMIQTETTRLYAEIASIVLSGDGQRINFVTPLVNDPIASADVIFISTMELSRLDQDIVTLTRSTDMDGTMEASLSIKSAPDLRVV